MFITFYRPIADDEVESIATGQTMAECAIDLIADIAGRNGQTTIHPAYREIVADNDIADMPVITLDEGILDIRDGWAFFTPHHAIPTNTDVYDF